MKIFGGCNWLREKCATLHRYDFKNESKLGRAVLKCIYKLIGLSRRYLGHF